MLYRRDFLAACAGVLLSANFAWGSSAPKKRIAFIGPVVHNLSHAQHFLDRETMGYAWRGKWQLPRMEVASIYLDQFPEKDLGKQRIARHKLAQFSSVAEALTLGGSKLAVDGVVIIGEH